MFVPSMVLKQLYTFGSLKNVDHGVTFAIKNRLSDAEITELISLSISDQNIGLEKIKLILDDDSVWNPSEISPENAIDFPLRRTFNVLADIPHLPEGKHQLEIVFRASPFGKLTLKVDAAITKEDSREIKIPRDSKDDFSESAIKTRQKFLENFAKIQLEHIPQYSFDSHMVEGNCEHFIGVAQIPLGIAGPIKVNGEYAKGDFLVPMATSEGTLIASYNRGIKIINLSGGVRCTVQEDVMQRAPVFVFEHAGAARDFVKWVFENLPKITEEAEATTTIGKLDYIDPYLASKFAYLRFNFKTGDAAGQNMVGRATFAACSWILDSYKEHRVKHFYLESNLATDKKASQINVMKTRGKRVTAECIIPRDVLVQHMRVDPEHLVYHGQVANVGAILSGANNNGLHSANGITAIFIATGQDVANVAESSAGIIHSEVTSDKDLYISITIPSLIVATYGGGTGLATQKESLELLGCFGKNKVNKLAEIIAGVVLGGEISLAAAISSSDWVSSHEKYGRNR